MNLLYKIFTIAIAAFFLHSCNYLDVMPEEQATEKDAFGSENAATRYLYSCYGYLPQTREAGKSLDLLTSDEIITAFEHETFAEFPKGNYTPVNPVISYWNTLFKGIRQCYLLLDGIDSTPNMSDNTKKIYKAEATYLIAYYHYLLLKCYGPTLIIDALPNMNMPSSDYPERIPYDKCVEWIAAKFDEAIDRGLVDYHEKATFGRATRPAALAFKARMLLYAASPLFNGGYCTYDNPGGDDVRAAWENFKNADGEYLISPNYDASKWQKAADANLEAIKAAEGAGIRLYQASDLPATAQYPLDLVQRTNRYVFVDKNTRETIWTDTRQEGYYDLQNKSTPFNQLPDPQGAQGPGGSWNGVSPTMTMLRTFYSKNGLPIQEDPEYDFENSMKYSIPTDTLNFAKFVDGTNNGESLNLNMDREPRFYSWISFHNGWYELYSWQYDMGASEDMRNRMVTQFYKDGNCGIRTRTNNFSPTGYLNKKCVSPDYGRYPGGTGGGRKQYPWPLIRLAEVYLNYAEALIEVGGQNNLNTAMDYINKVRTRAGIPTVQEAWAKVPGVTLDQDKLRQIVRQERTIELYLENQRFWDVRRWLQGTKYLGKKMTGLNYNGNDAKTFFQELEVNYTRVFRSPQNYLLPIPIADINKNVKIIQNPGY